MISSDEDEIGEEKHTKSKNKRKRITVISSSDEEEKVNSDTGTQKKKKDNVTSGIKENAASSLNLQNNISSAEIIQSNINPSKLSKNKTSLEALCRKEVERKQIRRSFRNNAGLSESDDGEYYDKKESSAEYDFNESGESEGMESANDDSLSVHPNPYMQIDIEKNEKIL